jgi:hypothetical protein
MGAFQAMKTTVPEHDEASREQPTWRIDDRAPLDLVIWLLVPLLCVWLISLRHPLFTDRYLIWTAPAFYLLVTLSLTSFATIEHEMSWIVVPLLATILVINGVNLQQQATKPIKSDFRAAAAYVADYQEPPKTDQPVPGESRFRHTVYLPTLTKGSRGFDDLVIFQIPHGRYTFDYYFPIDEYPRAEGLYTNHRTREEEYLMGKEQVARQMREMTRGHSTIWLIATEVPMWDKRNLVQQWLDQHALRVTEAHFHRVDIYRYEFDET